MSKNIMTRSFQRDLSVSDVGEVSGYACRWDEVDSYGTMFRKGCFAKTIAERFRKIVFLFSHDVSRPLGPLLELYEDDIGLFFRALFSAAQSAQDVRQLVVDGAVSGVSFAFTPVRQTSAGGATVYNEVKLYEISLVAMPANDNARVIEARAVPNTAYSDDMPLAPRNYEWGADTAIERVRAWAGGDEIDFEKYRRAFMWYDEENAENLTAYKLPFCDIINGELYAVPRAIFAIAGGHGVNAADIPEDDKERIRAIVNSWYARMRDEFDDDSLISPFERDTTDSDWRARVDEEIALLRERVELLKRAIDEMRAAPAWREAAPVAQSEPPETAPAERADDTMDARRDELILRIVNALKSIPTND